MIECLASLSDICKKSFFALLLIVLFCCPVFAEEAEQPADANRPAALTERQLKLIESMGVEYSEGESFEEIMSRAREQYKQEKEERGADSTSLMEERLQITPEMIKKQEEAAKKAREEYEARRERLLRANQDKISPEAMKVLDPKGEIQKSENEEPRQDPELTVDTAQAAQVPKVEEPRSVEQTDEQGATGYSAADKISDENKELELTITLPEKVEITSLIELVGKQLGLNYIYDPAEVKGEVMLKVHNGKIKVKDTYALLESVLKFRGFVMTRRGDLVTIVPAAKATEIDPVLVDDSGEVKPGDVIVTSIFKLENITTDIAQNLLTSMNLSSNIIALPETRSIIVTGYAYRMKRIEQMLALVDVPGERRDFSYRRLEYTLASSVVDKIQALAENLGTVDVTIATGANQGNQQQRPQPVRRDSRGRIIPQPAQPQQPQGPSTDVIQSETAKYGVYLDVDDRTNRILMVGTEDDIREVNRLIDTFDVPKQDLRRIVKYKIEYADASDILTALEDLKIISTGVNSSSSRTPTNRPTPQQQGGAPQQSVATDQSGNVLLDEPQVVMIEPSNSLLVNATDEQHEKIKSIIGFIDQQPEEDQAPVKVYPLENQSVEDIRETLESVVEKVAKEKAEAEQGAAGGMGASATGKIQKTSIGKNIPNVVITGDEGTNSIVVFASRKDQEWIAELIKSLDKKRPQVLIDVTLVEITQDDKFTYDLNAVTNITGNLDDSLKYVPSIPAGATSSSILEYSWGGGSLNGFYSDENIQAVLDLMQEKNYGRIMAKPKLLVNDNQEGEIKSENTEYIANVSTNVLGEQGTNTSTDVSWEDYTAGITLNIKPHISEGDLLRLEIALERTDFGAGANQFTPSGSNTPITGPKDMISSNIDTVITVPNESTIILGGLTKINQNKGGSKVPFLGDIPIVGILFRGINNSDTQSKLYVFIKANILRPDESRPGLPDLERESDIHREAFEESEREFQKYQEWPGLDADPVEPRRVLEMK